MIATYEEFLYEDCDELFSEETMLFMEKASEPVKKNFLARMVEAVKRLFTSVSDSIDRMISKFRGKGIEKAIKNDPETARKKVKLKKYDKAVDEGVDALKKMKGAKSAKEAAKIADQYQSKRKKILAVAVPTTILAAATLIGGGLFLNHKKKLATVKESIKTADKVANSVYGKTNPAKAPVAAKDKSKLSAGSRDWDGVSPTNMHATTSAKAAEDMFGTDAGWNAAASRPKKKAAASQRSSQRDYSHFKSGKRAGSGNDAQIDSFVKASEELASMGAGGGWAVAAEEAVKKETETMKISRQILKDITDGEKEVVMAINRATQKDRSAERAAALSKKMGSNIDPAAINRGLQNITQKLRSKGLSAEEREFLQQEQKRLSRLAQGYRRAKSY